MESPSRALTLMEPSSQHHPLSCINNIRHRRRISRYDDSTNSPEFEFWNLGRNPEPNDAALHSADELFSDGFLLPLQLLSSHRSEPDHGAEPEIENEPGLDHKAEPGRSPAEPDPGALITSTSNSILSASKRWKEIFKRGEKKHLGNNTTSSGPSSSISSSSNNNNNCEENKTGKVEKKKGKERKNNSSGNNANSSAELNINIWPFSRSRSAGNNSSVRSKPASNRKVSSAPCSRSNSSGDKSRRSWPSSPGRAGLHLGRASPVWQVKRNNVSGNRASTNGVGGNGGAAGKGRVLKLNVPVCIGYRQHVGCRSDENGAVGGGGDGGGSGVGGLRTGGGNSVSSNGNLFGLRGLFSKKGGTVLTV